LRSNKVDLPARDAKHQRGCPLKQSFEKLSPKEQLMKMITSLVVAASLMAGIAVATAQQSPSRMDERANGSNRAVEGEGNAGGMTGSSTNSPSQTAPSPGSSGSTKQMDEQANGTNGAVERNPNGSPGGSKANPSPR
jgi:hypothetical protein